MVGKKLDLSFNDKIVPIPAFDEMFKRTITVWGEENHNNMARARIGIVGLGSVGSMVTKILSKMGMKNFTLIDYDEIQRHNLDRLEDASINDIGKLKIEVAKTSIETYHTADSVDIKCVPCSVVEEEGFKAALECDVIFCCVDRPRPRRILDNMAYVHLIPVINGGIKVRFKDQKCIGIEWQAETVAPNRACMECLGSYSLNDVALEEEGKLDDPRYMEGIPEDHHLKANENVFAFSVNLASMEVMHLLLW